MKPETRRILYASLLLPCAFIMFVSGNGRFIGGINSFAAHWLPPAVASGDLNLFSVRSGVTEPPTRQLDPLGPPLRDSAQQDGDERPMTACPLMAKPFVLSASGTSARHGPARAFDHSNGPDSFWEVLGAYPFWLQVEYRSERTVSSYSFQTGEEVSRMPTQWELQGWRDESGWVVLDRRSDQTEWEKNEIKTFTVSRPNKYRVYRLFFMAGLNEVLLRIYEIAFHVSDHKTDFVIWPEGTLEWTDRLRIRRSPDQSIPDFKDGRKRARSGGTLVIQPQGDWRRGAIDLIPTNGKLPDVDALAEITLHRIVPSPEGFEMVSLAALATENVPFGLIVEAGGKGKPRPFVFWTLHENTEFTEVTYAEAFRVTEDGTVQIGRRRGKGTAAGLLADDTSLNNPRPVDALFFEKEDPADSGWYDSDYFKIVAKSRRRGETLRHEWRMNVCLDPASGDSALVVRSRQGNRSYAEKVAIHHNGDVELMTKGGGIILCSPNGSRWRLTVDDSGGLRTSPVR